MLVVCIYLIKSRFYKIKLSTYPIFCSGCRKVVQEVQAGLRGRSGQELPDQLPRHEPHDRQVEVNGQEVADSDRGSRRRQDHRRISPQVLLHRLHHEAGTADPKVLLRPEPAGNLFFSTFGVLLKQHYSPTISNIEIANIQAHCGPFLKVISSTCSNAIKILIEGLKAIFLNDETVDPFSENDASRVEAFLKGSGTCLRVGPSSERPWPQP